MANKWQKLPHLLRVLYALAPRDIAIVGALHLAFGLMPIALVIALRHVVDHAVALIQGQGNLHATLLWLGGLVIACYLSWASMPIREWMAYGILARFKARTHERLLAKASRLPLQVCETPRFYDQLHRAHRGVDERLLATMESLMPIPAHFITCMGLLIYLATISYALPLALLAGLIPGHLIERKYDQKRYQLIQKHTPSQRRLDYLGDLMIRREAAAEIRLFGLENELQKRWQALFFAMRQERLRLAFARVRAIITGVIGDQIAYSLVLTGIVALIARGSLSVGSYVACMDAVVLFRDAALMLFNGIRTMEDDLHYLGDLLAYLKLEEEGNVGAMPSCSPEDTSAECKVQGDRVPEVRFEGVTFRYPGSDTPVLDRLNLTLHAGERVALVGENGAGKTTLAKLLLGLYLPEEGQITVNGRSLADLDIFAWRKMVGAVFQDYTRYQITARENIGFGNLHRLYDDAAIRAAADKSGASEVIAGLSQGYETVLGRLYDESGHDLSMGQWQKLALARAYLRDAQVLVLDEPTAALDARAEVEVYRQFQDMSRGKSVLLISHRLGCAPLADRIVFLERGQITEEGSHQTLVQKGGRYADMFALQAAWYQ